MNSAINLGDEIELVDEHNGLYARIRIREKSAATKASIFLAPDQLEEFGRECLALAEDMRSRR